MTPDIRPQLDSWKGPRDDKNRPIVPLRNGETMTLLCTDLDDAYPIVGVLNGTPEKWMASGAWAEKCSKYHLDILLPQQPAILAGHNPANLTAADLDKLPQGKGKWRLLNCDEINPNRLSLKNRIARWRCPGWSLWGECGASKSQTYATDLTIPHPLRGGCSLRSMRRVEVALMLTREALRNQSEFSEVVHESVYAADKAFAELNE